MNTENYLRKIIDNSDNYFQLNEIVYKTDTKDHLNRYLFKSLERNFSAFIYEIQTTPHAPAKNGTIQND